MLGQAGRVQTAPNAVVSDGVALEARAVLPWRALAPAVLLSLALGAALYAGLGAHRSRVAPARALSQGSAQQGLSSLPPAAQGPVSAALAADDPAYRVTASHGGFRASNPAQRLSTAFARSGVSVSSGATRLGLSVRGVGYGSSLTSLGGVLPVVRGNRVIYEHPGLSEWYANGPLGLEQGFTLARAPAGHRAGPLTLSMTLSGNVQASLAKGGQSVTLTRSGKSVLRYAGLSATDARGRALRSWLQLDDGRLLLRVDATGARYPLRIDPFVLQGSELTGAGEIGAGEFGNSVALTADGNTALVGAPLDNAGVGAVWVFTRVAGVWGLQEELTAPNSGGEAEIGAGNFGKSVALSSDGSTALIGGPEDNGQKGAVWAFTRAGFGAQYVLLEKVSGEPAEPLFGFSVALSSDGATALVGGAQAGYVGAARVLVLQHAGLVYYYNTQAHLAPNGNEVGNGGFGYSVALSSDGNTALVGGCCDAGDGLSAGAAWAFTRDPAGVWKEEQKITDGVSQGVFGTAVALSSDGNTALIGSYNEDTAVGAARVFTRANFGSQYTLQERLTGNGEIGEGIFGVSVALSSDGNTALIGGSGYRGVRYGAAWVFTRASGTWTQQQMITGSPVEIGEGRFGISAALACETALIGGSADNGDIGAAWPLVNGPGPCPPHWYSNGGLITPGEKVTVATSGTLTFPEAFDAETVVTCQVTDQETIENPVGGGAGTDEITQLTLSSCFIPPGNPNLCGTGTPEMKANNIPSWPTVLISGSRDEITGVELEMKCSNGQAFVEKVAGTLTPTISNSVLTFDEGSGALTQVSPYTNPTSVIGTDNLTGPPGDERITVEASARTHWYSDGTIIPEGTAEPVASKGVIALHVGPEVTVTCKVKDHETIENPVGGGDGTDELTELVLSGCKAKPSPCPKKTKPEIIARKLPWLTDLAAANPVGDVIEGVDLEVKCSNGAVLGAYSGTLMPAVGNSVLEFGAGSGELEDAAHSKAAVTGMDTLKGPKKDTTITARTP